MFDHNFSQPKGARAVLDISFPIIANSGLLFMTISGASSKSALPPFLVGARSNFAHSASNLPGFGVAALLTLLVVDSSTYEYCVYCITAAFLPMEHWSIDSEDFLSSFRWFQTLSNWERVLLSLLPPKFNGLRGVLVFLLVNFCNRPRLHFCCQVGLCYFRKQQIFAHRLT